MDQAKEVVRPLNPKESAGLLSTVTFFYTFNLIKQGCKHDLEDRDIYRNVPSFESQKLGNKFSEKWKRERVNHVEKPSVYRLLLSAFGKKYLFLGFIQLFMRTSIIFLQPSALGKLVAYFKTGQTEISKSDAYYYGSLVILLSITECIYNHNYMQYITELSIRIRTSFSSLIYRKALSLSTTTLSDITIGKIVTIITKDVFVFDSSLVFINDMWIGLIQTSIITYLIYARMGISAFAGVGFFLLMIPPQLFLGKKTTATRLGAARKTDERLQVTQEALSAIKIIKMYTWEKFFGEHIKDARRKEINRLQKIYYLKALSLCIGSLCSRLSLYLLLMTYISLGHQIDAELVYFVMSCFFRLRSYITISIPIGIVQTAELIASLKRIQQFLLAEEATTSIGNNTNRNPKIYLKNVAVKIKDVDILKDVSLDVSSGLLLITGPVGSGKSSLLKTILQDYKITQGQMYVEGSVSYAPQEPWLFPSTIKQNILFGQTFDQKRYETVLKVCALTYDINQLENGDNTVVGDRGINLSKGQKARINLARAIYKQSDIYLLDDTLTALDNNVNKYVYKECIQGFLKDKLCVLVTHNAAHLKETGNVLIIEHGKTLNLEQQKKRLDKRITYYIDHSMESINLLDDGDEEKNYIDDKEDSKLLQTESIPVSNIYHEQKQTGKVKFGVYKRYCKFCGGCFVALFVFSLFGGGQFTMSYADKLISVWVNLEQKLSMPNNTTDADFNSTIFANVTTKSYLIQENSTVNNTIMSISEEPSILKQRANTLYLYTIMIVSSTALTLIKSLTHFYFSATAARNLHKAMALTVIKARMSFFDSHFIGNILNRFSKDLATVDEYIPYLFFENFRLIFFLIGVIMLIVSTNWIFIIPTILLFTVLYIMRKYYLPTGRSLKRLDASTRSPMVGYLNATLEGLTTIRAYKTQNILKQEFDRHQDHFTSTYYMMICSSRAFGFFIDMFCNFYVAAIIIYFLVFKNDHEAGTVGLAISQAQMLTGVLQWAIRQWAEMESQMTSVERILEYTDVSTETNQGRRIENWPTQGKITYKNVSLTYPTSQGEVLKNLNFVFEAHKKIGIIGRTGAGKSSIVASLFRLYEPDGQVLIDNVDIKTLSLTFLRAHIGIIPQDPVLFSGSVRTNIDPIGKYMDADIWSAIQKVKLKDLVPSLDYKITESGNNFSSGQRQLICLARALVSKNKMIILDEATANMDPETDELLHNIIKENFKDCTVITIAHRLKYVLENDKVLVIDDGKILEYDTPEKLMENNEGALYKILNQ